MIPLTPALTMFSIAVICDAVSPSCLPDATISWTPSFFACAFAPLIMSTKYGLVLVFTIRPTLIEEVVRACAVGRASLHPTRNARLTASAVATLMTQRKMCMLLLPSADGTGTHVIRVDLCYR